MRVRKALRFLMFIGLSVGSAALLAGDASVRADTLTVCLQGCQFTSIQMAIDSAGAGDTITVGAGTYTENLTIDRRNLTIRGENPESVIIQARFDDQPVVQVSDREVALSNLTLAGGRRGIQAFRGVRSLTLSNLIIRDNSGEGVFLEEVRGGELFDSIISNNGGTGVFIGSRAEFRLQGNRIQENQDGVEAFDINRLELRANFIIENRGCGLKADEASADPSVLVGENNVVFGNGQDLCSAAQGRRDLLDQTPPSAPRNLTVTPADWTNRPITVDWENPEDIAGIAAFWFKAGAAPTSPTDGTRRPIAQKPLIIENLQEGEQPVYVWLEDGMGNKSHQNSARGTIKIDKTPPMISFEISPQPNANGWNNGPVRVEFHCSDALSGIAGCSGDRTVSSEGANQSVTGSAEDRAGNTNSTTVYVNIDLTRPTVRQAGSATCSLAGNAGWCRGEITVPFEASDNLSGFAPDGRRTIRFERSTSQEGRSVSVGSGTVEDRAGNRGEATAGPFKIDKTPPMISFEISPQPNANGWNNSDVTVRFNCEDQLSGVASCTPETIVSREGQNQVVQGEVVDRAGNRTTATARINLDKTPPTISATISPPPNAQGWNNSDVTVRFECRDGLSGIAQCPSSVTLRAEGANQPITGEAVDRADNRISTTVTVNVDKSPPTGTLLINEGAATTTQLIVTLSWNDVRDPGGSGPAQMRFSNDGVRWSDWEPFLPQRSNWDLSAFGGSRRTGSKTVFGQLQDNAGNISRSILAEILYRPLIGNPLFVTSNGASFAGTGNGALVKIDISNPLAPLKTEIVRRLNSPADAVCGPDKRIYFTDWGSGKVYVVDQDGRNRVEIANLQRPEGVAFSPAGDLYVSAENGLWRIRNGTGPVEQVASTFTSGTGFLNGAGGLAFLTHGPFAGDLLVIDTAGDRVLRFPAPLYAQPLPFISEGLDEPIGIAVNSQGEVFVSNFQSKRIQIYSPTGQFLGTLGERISLRPFRPIHMEFGPDDTLYLAEWGDFVGQGWVARITDTGLHLIMALVDAWGVAIC